MELSLTPNTTPLSILKCLNFPLMLVKPIKMTTPITAMPEVIKQANEFRMQIAECGSERRAAEAIGIPRGTLRAQSIKAESFFMNFTEQGWLEFIHKIEVACMHVFAMMGGSGSRLISLFLELSGLDKWIAPSHGSIENRTNMLIQVINGYQEQEVKELSAQMPVRRICVAQDESFIKGSPCLTSLELISGYILHEELAPNRTAEQWHKTFFKATKGLNVYVDKSTSDEGVGILKHVSYNLLICHVSDLFHILNEIIKGTSGPLASKVRSAEAGLEQAKKALSKIQKCKSTQYSESRPVGRPFDYDKRINLANTRFEKANAALEEALKHQVDMKMAKLKISEHYHAINLSTGLMMNTSTIRALLTADFAEIDRITQAASLSQKSMDRIEKAKRSTENMVTAVANFKVRVDCEVRKLDVDDEVKEIIKKHLIPKAYFNIALPKQQKDNIKDMMKIQIKRIDEELRNNPTWGAMPQKMQDELINYSEDLAQLFQRSSSSLEGRNNQLKYHVRSLHHLNQNRLTALTCTANFFVKRPDGTTAAERFFGMKPTDLFSFLLSNLPYCARPAQKRS